MIESRDQLIKALGNQTTRVVIDKASLASQLAGRYASLWRATGQPAQAAIPTTPAVPTGATLGAIGFPNQTLPVTTYLGWMWAVCSNSATTVEVHDRVAHMGGLVLNTTTPQVVTGMDISTLAPSADRIGAVDYSDLQPWLEVYTDGGATAANATINVTYDDGTTGNLNNQAVASLRVGHMLSLNSLIPLAKQGRNIRGINTVTLSASTGTAGNFGFTFSRPRSIIPMPLANYSNVSDWAALGLPAIPNDSCLALVVLPATTSTGTLRGGGKLIYG